MRRRHLSQFLLFATLLLALILVQISCGGHGSNGGADTSSFNSAQDICNCVDQEPASSDYRTVAKHVDLPQIAATDISVATVLGFPVAAEPAFDAPRQGRELQMFHIANAFLQLVWLNPGDCDLHLEISDFPDKNAQRIIVETPHGNSYCGQRRALSQALSARGITISNTGLELATPLAVDVIGLAFQDFNHSRGSPKVATPWELHPAVVTIK